MKRILLASAVLAWAGPAAAQTPATKWFVLDTQDAKCMPGAEAARRMNAAMLVSPFTYVTYLRRNSLFRDQTINRDENGKVVSVTVYYAHSRDGLEMTFFATPAACDDYLKHLLEDGSIGTPEEMK